MSQAVARLGGTARTRDLLAAGIHPRDLYAARDEGVVFEVGRGLFRGVDFPPVDEDLLVVTARMPRAVLCTVSALDVHGLTEEIPRAVHVALPRGVHPARLAHPPLEVYWCSEASLAVGVEEREFNGVSVRVTTPAKSIADAFKFRSRVGHEVGLGALREALRRRVASPGEIDRMARVCRVQAVVRPYLEALCPA